MKNTGITYTSAERSPVILPEMAELLPPLSAEQSAALEEDLLRNGCYAPIIVNEDMVIVDGHNRQSLCEKHGLPYTMAVFSFEDLLEAKQWALDTQKNRRNLEKWELGKIALAHVGSDAVNEHEVSSLVACTTEVKSWEFLDAMSARNAKRCLLYLSRMKSVSAGSLIVMSAGRVRELICAKSLVRRGEAHAIPAALGKDAWKVKHHVEWAGRFTAEELREALIRARDAERASKSGTKPEDVSDFPSHSTPAGLRSGNPALRSKKPPFCVGGMRDPACLDAFERS